MTLRQRIDDLVADAALIRAWVTGGPTTSVNMGAQVVRSPARLIAENQASITAATGQVQNSTTQWLTNVTGTSALTGNLTPPITAYVPGQTFRFIWPHNTPSPGPLTLSINGLPPVSIRGASGHLMEAGNLPPWALVEVVFDGTVFLTTHAASASDVIGVARQLGFSSPANSISLIGRAGPEIGNLSNGAAALTFHRHGAFAANFGLDTDNILKIGGWSFGNVAHQIAHGGNPNPTSINTGALGSGTANATTFLRGDRTFQSIATTGGTAHNHWVRFANGFTIAAGIIHCISGNGIDYFGSMLFSRAFGVVLNAVIGGVAGGNVDPRMLGQVHVAILTNTRLDIAMRNNVNTAGNHTDIGFTVYGWS